MKTTFLVVGSQKAGTTSLNYCLSQHPAICTGNYKEGHFFNNDEHFATGDVDYELYHQMFTPTEQTKQIGECTPIYMYWGECMQRIKNYNPDIKLIVILRNPIDRAYSHWQMEYNRESEILSFEDAILLEGERLEIEGVNGQHFTYSYLDRGFYAWQIKKMLKLFDRKQIHFVKAEDMKEDMAVSLYKIFQFLGLEYLEVDETAQHLGDYQKSLDPYLRNQLIDVFKHDIKEVEDLLDWKCKDWLQPAKVPAPVYARI